MAYTAAQLETAYTNANLGKAPDAATKLTLDAYATQSQTGGISDAVALANTLKLVNNTTSVAIQTYQFFTNRAPSAAGLDYLVDSTTNTNDLNDASGIYGKLTNQENRFINFSINLATGSGEGATAFAAAYKDVSYEQTVATAYDKIIGNAVAKAAGVDVDAAVKYLSRAENIAYLTAFVKANTGLTAAADIDLAVKAALIGTILNAGTQAGIGGYYTATTAMITDLSDGTLSTDNAAGVNIITSYPSTGTVGTTTNLTVGIDTVVGTANNDTINGTATAVANSSTVNLLDSIDGGLGSDTLNLSNAGAATDLDPSALTVKNVETLNFTSVTGLNGGALDVSGWTGLTQANVSLAAPAVAQTVTAATTTGVALTAKAVGANNLTVQGGAGVTVTSTGASTGTIAVGTTTASTGDIKVTTTSGAYVDGANLAMGTITTKGGSSVTVTQSAGITSAQSTAATTDATNFTVTLGAIGITGTTATKSVTVSQDANVTEVDSTGTDGKIGVTAGAVTITDVNSADNTKAGVISTVSITNGTSATINSNALTSLTVNGATGVAITANVANATVSKSLTITAAGGTSAVTDTNSEITTLTVNATAASSLSFVDAGLTTLNVNGSKLLTYTGANANNTALKTVTVTGAGGLTADLSGATLKNVLTKVDTTGATGASTITIDASGTAKTAYAGGAGVDSVTIVNAVASGASIQLGAGADRLLAGAGGSVTTSATTVIDGGDGSDAIASSLVTAGNASMFKNFEVVNLSNTGNSTFDVALLTGSTVTGLEINGGTGVGQYANVTLAQGTTVTGAAAANDAKLAFTGAAGTADAYTVTFAATGASTSTATAPTTINAGILRTDAVENLTIVSGAASGFTKNQIALADANAKTLTVTGSQAAQISFDAAGFGTAGANGLSSIDASAATGAITLNTANVGSLTGGFTIKTGSGADAITIAAGQDTTITTGGGKDNVNVALNLGVAGTYATATAAAHTTIMDLSAGDSITFVNTGTEVFTATKVNVDAAANFSAALDLAAAGAGNVNGIITWFQYGGNTYIVNDNTAAANFDVATDIVVKLNGTVDLSTATNSASNVLTLN